MAQPTNVFSAYDASGTTGVGKGNREDLLDIVSDISPTDTPLFSALPSGKASAVLHEWTTRALRAAAANEQIEGDDATITAGHAKTRLNNRTAIAREVAGVTRTQQVVDKVGMQDALAEEVMLKTQELKLDIEFMLHANTAKVAGDDTTARKAAGFPTWITNDSRGASGSDPTGDGSNTATNGTQRAFTEDLLLSVSQLVYTAGGNPTLLDVSPFQKRQMSTFAGNQTRQSNATDKKIVNSIDVYEDDFNKMKVVPNRQAVSRTALLIDTDMAKVAWLRRFETIPLAVTGSSMKTMIEGEWTLEVCNPAAHGVIADLTTS
jgi:hypothetical protein